jgi:hypothetical protein
VYVCVNVCVFVWMSIHMHIDIHTREHIFTYRHTHTCAHIHLFKLVLICVNILGSTFYLKNNLIFESDISFENLMLNDIKLILSRLS